ncbi:MAG TPA: hypothetical protein VKV73_23055 [Chloroflexota bacterium]|nr:hypothetical protein [Chloroflexota bacterium]
MSSFEQVLKIAQEQAEAAARGDLMAAAARLQEREMLLRAAPPAVAADADVIREILRLDRDLSGAIRERMVAIRDEALEGQRGRLALVGYGHTPPPRSRMLDAVS